MTAVSTSGFGTLFNTFAAKGFSSQASWFIDETNGNDSNTGASSDKAIKTVPELNRRFYNLVLGQNTTVQAIGNLTKPLIFENTRIEDGFTLTVQGTATVVGTATISVVSAIGAGSTFPWNVTTTGIDWTTVTARRVTTNTGKVFSIVSVTDANNIVINAPYTTTGVGTLSSPVVSETLTVHSLSTVPHSHFKWAGSVPDVAATFNYQIKDFRFLDGDNIFTVDGSGKTSVIGCEFSLPTAQSGINDLGSRTQFLACRFEWNSGVSHTFRGLTQTTIIGGLFISATNGQVAFSLPDSLAGSINNCMFQTIGIFVNRSMRTVGTTYIQNYSSGDVVTVLGGLFSVAGAIGGQNNTGGVGINVGSAAALIYQTIPTVTSTNGDTKIGGTIKAYNTLPFLNTTNGAVMALLT